MSSDYTQIHLRFLNIAMLKKLSLKSITLLGFFAVALPLTLALIYSATKVNQLSQHGAQAVYSVAELANTNQQLTKMQDNTERFASQYIVLNDKALKQSFYIEKDNIIHLVKTDLLSQQHHKLSVMADNYLSELNLVDHTLDQGIDNTEKLEKIQQHFVVLSKISQNIKQITADLISLQADNIKKSAAKVEGLMINSLLMIPLTLVFAAIFTYLITQPLKQLIEKIKQLEQGNFKHKIEIESNPEVEEIALALEFMRQRLHALELQKTSFIRHISHELKTPLAAIREGNALLADQSVGAISAEQSEVCLIIKESVIRLQGLIEDLLDFNIVLDATSLEDNEQVALVELINKVIDTHKLEIKRKQITIDYQPELLSFKSNSKQLNVILENILSNAIKYSPQTGTIAINTLVNKSDVIINISDQGPGIDTLVAEQIFDAFYQGPKPKDSNEKGSGLGLTIVKELIMRLNGNIKFHRNNKGACGSTFSITLPYYPYKEQK